MWKNRILQDVLLGGGLLTALLLIIVVDRLVSKPAPELGEGEKLVTLPGNLLGGNRQIVVRMKAIASPERLAKLKVVRLSFQAKFAKNVNDVELMWCWDPKHIIRFEELNPTGIKKISTLPSSFRKNFVNNYIRRMKLQIVKNGDIEHKFEAEARKQADGNNLEPFINSEYYIEGKQAYQVFHHKVTLPLNERRSAQTRNLFFALSVSNLMPLQNSNFQVTPGDDQTVNGKLCDQFLVEDSNGLKLQFYFDKESNLLAKIAHKGHDPRGIKKEAFWEHYFYDYQKSQGIKQWRKAEIDTDGKRFVTVEVTNVQFYDTMQPELYRPE